MGAARTGTRLTDRFGGSPSASVSAGIAIVHARTSDGALGRFTASSTGWTYTNVGGVIADSPTSAGTGAYARGQNGTLSFFDGTAWHANGGRFD